MRAIFCIIGGLILAGCVAEPELSCDIFGPIEQATSSEEMLVFPDEIVEVAGELRLQLAHDESLAGFSGSSMARVAGTESYDFASSLNSLRRLVAYQVALEQANENDGFPLVDINNDRSCALLADSIASLDQGQSAEQLGRNLGRVREYFGPEYPYRVKVIQE